MKKQSQLLLIIIALLGTAPLTAFRATAPAENCTQWLTAGACEIQMKWCTDEYGEVSHQFRNGYSFEVHFYFKIECSDGKSYTGNDYVDAGALTNSADQMKSKPSTWTITRKEKKDATGKWVTF